jgi:hypothetical protein
MRGQPQGFDARVGHSWYELIYRPLTAEIYQDIGVKSQVQNHRLVSV